MRRFTKPVVVVSQNLMRRSSRDAPPDQWKIFLRLLREYVKVINYHAGEDAVGDTDGFVLKRGESLPHNKAAARLDERDLNTPDARERWLTTLFARAEFRTVRKSNSLTRLKHFHEYYRALLTVYHKGHTLELDRTVQNAHSAPSHKVIASYDQILRSVLLRTPRRRAAAASMLDALSHYAPHLTPQERTAFKRDVAQYVEKTLSLAALRKTVQVWAVRYDKTYVRQSAFWRPYPQALG